ncbi:hypothetical protein [Pannonibacter tanglangensis]|uniref:CHAD domain-containing protein n=1 Tax=Pannonibacter tanglangensis TaxID=2750084 RepID=A0ABW9ZMD7_9HYPH|nr:hypothetical protein [Pannonibacter sp. XCT-34]NBN64746.1 hypothetical protein [Pannonibacter sp. XCT-34]
MTPDDRLSPHAAGLPPGGLPSAPVSLRSGGAGLPWDPPLRASQLPLRPSFGERLRVELLLAIMTARAALADQRLPLAVRLGRARPRLQQARLLLKVCRDGLGPAHAPRAARLKLASKALKLLADGAGLAPVGLVGDAEPLSPEDDRQLAGLDALLRRCEVDAVTLAPGLIDAVGAAEAFARARRQSHRRAARALAARSPEICRKWLKALRRQAVLAGLLVAEWPEPGAAPAARAPHPVDPPPAHLLQAHAEDLARYLKVDALYRRLCAQRANGAVPLASPEAVRIERKALWRRLRQREARLARMAAPLP